MRERERERESERERERARERERERASERERERDGRLCATNVLCFSHLPPLDLQQHAHGPS